MAITVKHSKVSLIPDSGDNNLVEPSDWNADHVLTGTIPISNGGTGASTANDAFNALAPTQTGNSGKYLTTDGTNTSWAVNPLGTVTSVGLSAPSIFTVSGSPVTTSGTLTLSYSGTALPVANGGTGVTSSSGANSVVLRDANGNITTNCLFEGFTSQAASGTSIVLTASSVQNWIITGSGGQNIQLPDASTLPNGALFTFNNNQSSGTIVVKNNSGTTICTTQSGAFIQVSLLSNLSSAGSWDYHNLAPSNVSWSTNTFDYPGSITSATWNGNVVAYNRGGTGQSSAFTQGGVVYGSSTSALATSAVGSAGQVLTSQGTSAPTWTTPTTGTVTSVSATAGTGISITGSPITSSGTLTITNTAPDQTVAISGGTGISVSGTYPNFTVTNTSPSSGGTVTSVTGTAPISVATGTTTPAISISQATTSTNGYLSSTDWNTFNNKQPAGTYVNSVSGTTGRITSTGGVTPVIDLASGIATAGTTGSSTLIPVITIDTYGRVTNITTASNPQGTVTSVSGTGTVSGISLSGTVTSSGSLTLSGTLDLSSPPAIGGTTPNLITGTTITGTKFVGISGGTF